MRPTILHGVAWLSLAVLVITAPSILGIQLPLEAQEPTSQAQEAAEQPSSSVLAVQPTPSEYDYLYLVLATNKTSTMQEEMQEAAETGYSFVGLMGGATSFGGSEVVVVMERQEASVPRFEYRLLATSKTSTMQKELQEAGDAGFSYRGQTVFDTTFGGEEPVVILERDLEVQSPQLFEYRLLATKKTSTMQKELREAGAAGFEFVGVTVASTRFGGDEVVAILKRPVAE